MPPSFGKIKTVNLRDVWANEAIDFTPWLSENLKALSTTLGMDLELREREAAVGDFSLDLLAKDLNSGRDVIIENQLTTTDHDHLGKLLTYAGGYNARVIIWIAESLRDEHRQALEWLNQNTAEDVEFFGVAIGVIQVDQSKPAFQFKPIVFPNEWQKSKRASGAAGTSPRTAAYKSFFQRVVDELREKHKFTGARKAQPQGWIAFTSGLPGISYCLSFAQGGRFRAEVYIDRGDRSQNKNLFDFLRKDNEGIEKKLETPLEWERLETKRASRVALYKQGSIDDESTDLDLLRDWGINHLLRFKEVVAPRIKEFDRKS